jgi:hypothetical protein
VHHGLGRRQITGGHDNDLAVTIATEPMHFAIGADLIDTRIGARIRAEHNTFIN